MPRGLPPHPAGHPALSHWRYPGGAVRYQEVRSWGRVWVTAGGPEAPADRRPEVAQAFEAEARRQRARVLWFAAESPHDIGRDRPSVVIGAEPVWRVARWPQIVEGKASLRAQIRRAANKGVTVEPAGDPAALRPVLTDWLARRGLPPMGFMADPFVLDTPGDREFWVARRGGAAVAYLALVPGAEAFVEWIVQSRAAPNGTAALLLDHVVRTLDPDSTMTLGMVPLSTSAPPSSAAPGVLVRALLAWTRAHATRFYNFHGLERFKAKFVPDHWRPLYLVTDGRPVTVWTFHAVAAAFAGAHGPTRFVARALAGAVADEAGRLRQSLGRRLSSRGSGRSPGPSG